jgi:hypothetical protein
MILEMNVVQVICTDGENRAHIERAQPLVIERIEQGQVFGGDSRFHIPGTAANPVHQNLHRRFEVNQQMRAWQTVHHKFE